MAGGWGGGAKIMNVDDTGPERVTGWNAFLLQ